MTDPRERLAGVDADGAREVEVTADGVVRDTQPVEVPSTPQVPAKATKLSPHTFGGF
jgi:hypothetical protein